MKNLILSAFITLSVVILFYLVNLSTVQKERALHIQNIEVLQIQIKNLQEKTANLETNLQNSQNQNQEIKLSADKTKSEISETLNKKIWDLETENRNLKLENIMLKEKINISKSNGTKFRNDSVSIEIN